MSNNNFFKINPRTDSFEEALHTLQGCNLSSEALEAIAYLAQSAHPKLPKINPLKHPLRAASLFAANKADNRTHLRRVRITGEAVEASDGHSMIGIQSDLPRGWEPPLAEAEEEPHWVGIDRAIPSPHSDYTSVFLSDATRKVLEAQNGQRVLADVFPCFDGNFVAYDARLIDRLRRVALEKHNDVMVRLHSTSPNTSRAVLVYRNQGVIVMIMPVIT